MPIMSGAEQLFCRSAPWVWWSRKTVLPWALQGVHLTGEVLEVGAGSGSMAAETLKQNPQLNLTLTDLDPKMVTAARNRLGDGHNVTVEQADATRLPFPDQSFDYVLNYLMLHHVIEWPAVLTEIHRVLKPGGRLLGYDLTDTRIARVVHQADRSPFKLITPTELEHSLSDAGFNNLQIRPTWAGHVMRFSATPA